ncbi:MAG: hypothetical protein M1839_003867 [Geoglossum umbratile]|nr:MAG: hypothetical protein M1839_003867 [Geoglossum umbratile]
MPSEDISSEQAKAGRTSPSSSSLGVPSISVSILSPSTELPNQLSFPCVPIASTVGELKQRIRDAVSSRPDLERLRLIHRGRMLSRDTDTMSDVFGHTVADDSSAKSLHLVLRPLVADSTNSGLPSLLGRQSPNPTLRGSTPTPHDQVERSVLAESLDHHLQEHNRATQRISHAMRHGQINAPPGPPLPTRHMMLPRDPGGATNGQEAPTFARYTSSQQQMGAVAEMTGLQPSATPAVGNPSGPTSHDPPQPHRIVPEDPPNGQNPFMPGSGGGFTRTYAAPNGQRWHTTVNYSSVTIPNFGQAAAGMPPPMPPIPHQMGVGTGTGAGAMPAHGVTGLPDLNTLLAAAAAGPTGGTPTQHGFPSVSGQTGATIQMPFHTAIRNQFLHGNNELDLSLAQVNQLRDQIHVLRQRLSNRLGSSPPHGSNARSPDERFGISSLRPTATSRNPSVENTSQRNPQPTPISSNTNSSANPSEQLNSLRTESQALSTNSGPAVSAESRRPPEPIAFLLSSPLGPHALVFSPHGLYGSGVLPGHRIQRAAEHTQENQRLTEPHRRDPGRHREAPHAAHRNDQRRPNHQARAPGNGVPFAGLLQGLAPIGANIWLIARLIGFVVLFTGNSSWQRTILLALGATIVFLIQIGILGPVTESVWGPIRRHIEGILLSPDRRRMPDANGNTQNAGARGSEVENAGLQGQQQRPDPRNTAARLVREHQQGQRAWIYEMIRAIERAIIIFVASLVPGLGERHIAELDAAQQIERIANERRAEAEAQEPIATRAGVEGAGTDSTNQRQTDGTSEAEARPERDSRGHDRPADRQQNAA